MEVSGNMSILVSQRSSELSWKNQFTLSWMKNISLKGFSRFELTRCSCDSELQHSEVPLTSPVSLLLLPHLQTPLGPSLLTSLLSQFQKAPPAPRQFCCVLIMHEKDSLGSVIFTSLILISTQTFFSHHFRTRSSTKYSDNY